MSRFPSPCIVCGKLSRNGTRCELHQAIADKQHEARRAQIKKQTGQYSGAYTRLAKIVTSTATQCAICKLGPIPNDPWEADHIIPSSRVTDISQLQAVHGSCNRLKGNRTT